MKVTREGSHTHYCLDGCTGTNGWDILILEQYEVYELLKERETFWQHGIETFYPIGLKKKRSTVFTWKSTSLELASLFDVKYLISTSLEWALLFSLFLLSFFRSFEK